MKMIQLNDFHTRIFLNEAEESRVPFVLVNTGHEEDEALFETLRKLCDKGFALCCTDTSRSNRLATQSLARKYREAATRRV